MQHVNVSAEGGSNVSALVVSDNTVQGDINFTIIHNHDAAHSTQAPNCDGFFKCQQKLKNRLKSKYEKVFEGIAKQGNPASLQKIYTELYITEGECVEICTEHEVRQIEIASRTQVTNGEMSIKCTDIFKALPGQDKQIRTVLTKGIAGIGKTVSVQKFILEWTEGRANPDIHFLLPVPFREINLMKEKDYSLEDFIHHFFSETDGLLFSTDDKYNIAFLFDGLDESRHPLNFQDNECIYNVSEPASVDVILTNLIKGNLLPSALVWITSRPAAANQIPPECVDQVTEVRGFTDSQKEEYFSKKISEQEVASRIITHLKSKSCRSLYIMCHIPVFCWMAATVLMSILTKAKSKEIPSSLTQMYTHFLIIQAKKHKDIWNLKTIVSLGRLAFQQLEKGNLIFYENDLRECGMDAKEASVYSGVCTQIFREEDGLYQEKVFCFVHLSIQEFLAALYVFLHYSKRESNMPNMSAQSQTSQLYSLLSTDRLHELHQTAVDLALGNEHGHLDLFLRFLLGLSLESNQKLLHDLLPQTGRCTQDTEETIKYVKDKIRKAQNPERCINLFHCLNELNDHSLVEEINEFLRMRKEDREDLSLSQISALAFVLLMSGEDMNEFNLENYGRLSSPARSDAGLLRMLPVIKTSTTIKLAKCNLTKESCSALASVLRSNPSSLRELILRENNVGDSGLELLSTGLQHPNCRLEKLELQKCNLTERSCSSLASALRSNPSSLRQLALSYNNLGDSGVRLLSVELGHPKCRLETMQLWNCNLTKESCSSLASALRSNPSSLKELDLSYNRIDQSGVEPLSDLLKDPAYNLTQLGYRW
ncbi:NACHT, LRR and PYD domains-containing protein 3-like [Engraulis encrasicolus]|uniref:NACHT, LRR and PYD domains-containing protein 3-like n=1 Tax=Engraulis encrasicolus TaxID=184585 RepID=UPI002FD56EC5